MMSSRCVRGGLALAAMWLMTACGSTAPNAPPPKPAPLPVAKPGAAVVNVSEANADASVTLEFAQELQVNLPIATVTRLEWTVVDLKPGVLTPLGMKAEAMRDKTDPDQIGVMTRWRFKPQAAGTVVLRFELRRAHSLEAAVQSVVYNVTVK